MIFRILAVGFCIYSSEVVAEDRIRIATYNVGLGRDGPGLLLKDILAEDEDIVALAKIIGAVSPEILLLTKFDHDYQNVALNAFRAFIAAQTGTEYSYYFATGGNAGLRSGLDLNNNGYLADWADNWGFGRFEGHESMALLSKFPIDKLGSRSFDRFLWRDLPGVAQPVNEDGGSFLPAEIWDQMPLSSNSHWDVPVELPNGQPLRILASHSTPPVFDGVENLNGLRNDAEIRFWVEYLNGEAISDDTGSAEPFLNDAFVILADFNADPFDGESLRVGLNDLLISSLIVDPLPASDGGALAAIQQAGANLDHLGDPRFDTANWDEAELGNLRVDYVLPSAALKVLRSGVYWPTPDQPDFALLEQAKTAHRLVWVDVALP